MKWREPENIDEINVALRLGDRVVPPNGCLGVALNGGRIFKVVGYMTASFLSAHSHWDLEHGTYKLLEIPENAPPFNEWPRQSEGK